MADYEYVRRTFTWEGKRYEVRGATKKEANEKLSELKAALKRGEAVIGAGSTVTAWYTKWKATYKDSSGITPKSLGMYDEKFNGYIRPAIGSMKLKDVREVHLQEILNGQAGRSFSHVSKLRMVMREIFSKAHIARLIPFDPSADLALPAYTKGHRRSLTDEERAYVLEVAETHRAGLWVLTILYTGMRPGETAVLQWQDVDFESNEIHVYKAMESGTERVKEPKTDAGERDIPIHSELRKRLLAARGGPFELVFTNTRGGRLTASSMRSMWNNFHREVDIRMGAVVFRNQIVQNAFDPDLTAYCLRHTFCTDLQRAGVPLNVAKELMGHSDIAVTANIYTHRDADTLHRGIEQLEDSANFQKNVGKNVGKMKANG